MTQNSKAKPVCLIAFLLFFSNILSFGWPHGCDMRPEEAEPSFDICNCPSGPPMGNYQTNVTLLDETAEPSTAIDPFKT